MTSKIPLPVDVTKSGVPLYCQMKHHWYVTNVISDPPEEFR